MTKFFLGVLLLLSCHSGSSTQNKKADTSSKVIQETAAVSNLGTAVKENPSIAGADRIEKRTKPLFDNHQPYEILSVVNSLKKNTTDTAISKCVKWILSKEDILHIINNSKPIDGTTWDLSFLVLTCTKAVKILQGNQQYDMEVNAGSFFSVNNGDTIILYGDFKKSDRKYFIEGPSDE